ncbi:hypothetical protein HRJ34_00290 [Rhizorhabdus wittichii]|uniref:Uncharacterized protein n=1 Tax=Rhizorhabdus wittichii TaxID=160791 RepID=A0A975HE66_9SPHN|nr:hypothetical protein [Rhizorhabdus wittichii]QTH22018.1 hypothetical protein HRJ34_00290 [Rhizorhabdus wittichii]
MTNVINNGARVPVVFDFYSGIGGVSRREGASDATIAIRENVRGAEPGLGTVNGQPVRAVKIGKSPTVPGMVLIEVVFLEEAGA